MLGMLNEFYNTSYKPISRGKDFQPHTIVKKKNPWVPKITYCVAIWGKSSIDIEHGLKGNLSKTPRCLKLDKISLKKFQSPYESVHVLMLDIPVWIINTNFSLIEVAATYVQREPILNKMIFKAYLDKFLL